MKSVKTIIRQFSVHVYKDDGPNYLASCMVSVYGDHGQMFLINGAGFYYAALEIFEVCEAHGIRVLEGYVTMAHARLMKRACRAFADVEIVERGSMVGQPMAWMTVERNKEE